MSREKGHGFFFRLAGSLFLLVLAFFAARQILLLIPGQAKSILYFLCPIFFGHFTPLLFIRGAKGWTPLDTWLPPPLQVGRDRTLQGTLLIFAGCSFYFSVRYLLFRLGVWPGLELKTQGGIPIFEAPGLWLLILILILASLVGDLSSHLLYFRAKSSIFKKFIKTVLFHVDYLVGPILGFLLWSGITGVQPAVHWVDWVVAVALYWPLHILVDRIVHWNSRVGLKHFGERKDAAPSQ